MDAYSRNELRVLWYLKRHGPMVLERRGAGTSLVQKLCAETSIHYSAMRSTLNQLEDRSLVLRTYAKGKQDAFASQGYNPLLRIELVDPNMVLPPLPQNPPAIVIMQENEELYERTCVEPSMEAIVLALIERVKELQDQIDRLQTIIVDQEKEVEKLRHEKATPRPVSHGLTQRVKDSLTPEQWERMRRG